MEGSATEMDYSQDIAYVKTQTRHVVQEKRVQCIAHLSLFWIGIISPNHPEQLRSNRLPRVRANGIQICGGVALEWNVV
jgi:hypothetical protein